MSVLQTIQVERNDLFPYIWKTSHLILDKFKSNYLKREACNFNEFSGNEIKTSSLWISFITCRVDDSSLMDNIRTSNPQAQLFLVISHSHETSYLLHNLFHSQYLELRQ